MIINKVKVFFKVLKILLSFKNVKYLYKNFKESLKSLYKIRALPKSSRLGFIKKGSLLKIGIIGGGKFAYNHLQVFEYMEDIKVSSMLSRGSHNSRELAKKFKVNNFTTNYDDFLNDNLDAVVVVSSIPELYNLSKKVIDNGIPTLIEKPVSFKPEEIKNLIEISNRNSTLVQVAYNRRFYSIVENGLDYLSDKGPIRGGVLEVPESIINNKNLHSKDITVVSNWIAAQSTHAIDLFNYILGGWLDVKHFSNWNSSNKNISSSYSAVVSFPNNVYGTILGLWDTPHQWKLRIIAETASLEFSPLEHGYIIDADGTRFEIPEDTIDFRYRRGIYLQNRHFVESIQNSFHTVPQPGCSLNDALSTLELALYLKQ